MLQAILLSTPTAPRAPHVADALREPEHRGRPPQSPDDQKISAARRVPDPPARTCFWAQRSGWLGLPGNVGEVLYGHRSRDVWQPTLFRGGKLTQCARRKSGGHVSAASELWRTPAYMSAHSPGSFSPRPIVPYPKPSSISRSKQPSTCRSEEPSSIGRIQHTSRQTQRAQ